jgi:hypothetical protein
VLLGRGLQAANVVELRKSEVRRTPLLDPWVNRGFCPENIPILFVALQPSVGEFRTYGGSYRRWNGI